MPKPPQAKQFLSQTRAIVKLLHDMRRSIVDGRVSLTGDGIRATTIEIDQAIDTVHRIADRVKISD